ncbi:MAG: hypothetical protein IT371_23625 [Deltaproteobacteria bacterium]|nr:hypothetical protein [Deltaproteobacteria bacterium]
MMDWLAKSSTLSAELAALASERDRWVKSLREIEKDASAAITDARSGAQAARREGEAVRAAAAGVRAEMAHLAETKSAIETWLDRIKVSAADLLDTLPHRTEEIAHNVVLDVRTRTAKCEEDLRRLDQRLGPLAAGLTDLRADLERRETRVLRLERSLTTLRRWTVAAILALVAALALVGLRAHVQ